MMFLVGWWCWCWWSCSSSAVASAAAIAEKTVEYKWQQPCPDHPDWQGYTSLEALQSELRQHDAWVVSSFSSSAIGTTATTEEDVHVVLEYPICPRTILNTTLQPLLIPPTLLEKYPLVILCLSPTSSEPSCIVRGGRTQVLVVESQQQQQQEPTTTASGSLFSTMAPQAQQLVQEGPSLTMQGLTFENSQDISLAILHATVTLQCVECHWTGCRGKSAVLLAEASEVASSVTGDETFRVRYTLHDHNIFGEHRRQERHRRQLNPNHEEDDDALLLLGGPTFYCIDCSFQVRYYYLL